MKRSPSCSYDPICGFLSHGKTPQFSSIFLMFREINHPAIGVPPWLRRHPSLYIYILINHYSLLLQTFLTTIYGPPYWLFWLVSGLVQAPGIQLYQRASIQDACSVHHTWRDPNGLELGISCLVGGWFTPLKNMSSSIGMISNPILMGK